MFKACFMGLTVLFALSVSTIRGHAETSDSKLILDKIAALEARISALEAENHTYRREAEEARAEVRHASARLSKASDAAILIQQPEIRAAHASYPPGQADRTWTGAYWGVSAGGAATRSNIASFERDSNLSQSTGLAPFVSSYDQVGLAGPNHGKGGLIDVFAGWNSQISRIVLGGQIEATYSDLDFSGNGSRSYTYFDTNGPTGTTATGDFRPQVSSRWMASALLRAGVLVSDDTLVYGIGGWSVANFEARNVTDNPFYQPSESFWAEGWTAGAGIEHRLDSSWRIRAEYRYTSFGTVGTNDHFSFQDSGTGFSGVEASQRQSQYEQSLQTGRIGIVYAFNPLR